MCEEDLNIYETSCREQILEIKNCENIKVVINKICNHVIEEMKEIYKDNTNKMKQLYEGVKKVVEQYVQYIKEILQANDYKNLKLIELIYRDDILYLQNVIKNSYESTLINEAKNYEKYISSIIDEIRELVNDLEKSRC